MEQTRKLRIKFLLVWSTDIQQGSQEHPTGKGQSLQQTVLGKLEQYRQNNKTEHLFYTTHKKLIPKDQSLKYKT